MDWAKGMNDVIDYIETNLDKPLEYQALARRVGCSVYEFSRIFSFMTGVPISEYIRRRRLSQAAFDIQSSGSRILDIAVKYGYETQASFARAFKELHGHTPALARKAGVSLTTYPRISFKFMIRGVDELVYRMEQRESFKIIGLKGRSAEGIVNGERGDLLWPKFMERHNRRLAQDEGANSYYRAPFWQVGAYWFGADDLVIGAELGDKLALEEMDVVAVPAAAWAVFTITSKTGFDSAGEAYARINTEWFPASGYRRDESVPHLEVYLPGDAYSDAYRWEIWMPVVARKA